MKNNLKFTPLHRMLHWAMALAMPVLFITGFLRMNWMNKHHIVEIIESEVGATLPKEQMTTIAKAIRAPMWEWHEIFAKVMIISFVIRILYMLVKGIRFPNPFAASLPLKERLQGLTYVYFYVFVFISAVTGICIEKGFFAASKDTIESIHKLGLYWFPIFVVLHFAGILIAEYSSKKGIVSKMIGGE
ncbi:MAG TPA: cytochrome b/b6 domain-containing protein [Flavobacterium sp.]|nr:cytochrome b/b6 domain-containing protein [Flavobacterium sp.]